MMFQFYYRIAEGRRKVHRSVSTDCVIGSGRNNDLVVASRKLSKHHARLSLRDDGVHISDLGSAAGTWVNRQRVREHGPLSEFDEVMLGDVVLMIDEEPRTQARGVSSSRTDDRAPGSDRVNSVSHRPCEVASEHSLSVVAQDTDTVSGDVDLDSTDDELFYWSGILHGQLLEKMDLYRRDINRMSDDQLRQESSVLLDDIVESLVSELPPDIDRATLKRNVLNEAVGLGPLERFLDDGSISEIMVNNHKTIFIERHGRIEKSQLCFSSDDAVYAVIDRIISPLGKRIDESSPIVDARLKDGSRVNAVIPPLALKGPSLTIRKFPEKVLCFDDMIAIGSVSTDMVDFLRICVEQRRNIVVSGGTGSGKTTLLNALSTYIPDGERIVTIEDAAELKLVQPNLVSLESRPPNHDGKREVRIRDLVRNALRMRPDRIVVGECRGGEALDMLQAMNTGHDGSLTTVHANSPRDVISRLEVLVLMAGIDLPVQAIREQIASAVDIIVHQARLASGERKIVSVTEVVGMESGIVQLQELFRHDQRVNAATVSVGGGFHATGAVPSFYEAMRHSGLATDMSLFAVNEGEMQ